MEDVKGSSARTGVGDRPSPTIPSLFGGVAALLLVGSLFMFLAEIEGDHRRLMGLLLSVCFEVIGVAILWLARGRRMASVGHGLTAIGVLPLVFHLFIDPADPGKNLNSVGDFTGLATGALVVLALLWGAAYVIGPGRRYGLYLAGALLAIWGVAVVQIVDAPLSQVADRLQPFTSEQTFTPIGPGYGDTGIYDDPYGDNGIYDDPFSDDAFSDDPFAGGSFDGSFDDEFGTPDGFDDGYLGSDGYPSGDIDDPFTKLGVVCLVFGGAYLFLAGRRDRQGDRRMATPLFAVAIPILDLSVLFLADDLEVAGTAFYAMVLGAAAIWLGSRADRRFTSWFGVWGFTGGVVALAAEIADDSATVLAVILLVLGLALAGALFALEGNRAGPDDTTPPDQPRPGVPDGPPNVVGSVPGGPPAVVGGPPPMPSAPPAPEPWPGPTFAPPPPAAEPPSTDAPTNPWGVAPPQAAPPQAGPPPVDPWSGPGDVSR